jgi:hypothetical protein
VVGLLSISEGLRESENKDVMGASPPRFINRVCDDGDSAGGLYILKWDKWDNGGAYIGTLILSKIPSNITM